MYKQTLHLAIVLLTQSVAIPMAYAQAAPSPIAVRDMAGWVAGTVMCIVIEGRNRDSTIPKKLPQGSGFLVNRYGYVLTNSHVVKPQNVEDGGYSQFVPDTIRATFDTDCDLRAGTSYTLEVIQLDDYSDLALLKIRQNFAGFRGGWRYLPIGDSNLLLKADRLLGIGYPQGSLKFDGIGQLSQLDRTKGRIETDLGVSRGFSGGPVLDERGYVVGVVWGGQPDRDGKVNLFIPINHARNLLRIAEPTP